MTTLVYSLVLIVPYCDRKTRAVCSQTCRWMQRELADQLGLGAPARDLELLAQSACIWDKGLGSWRCCTCGRLWELATNRFCCTNPECGDQKPSKELTAAERALFVGHLLDQWERPNYGVWTCTRCWKARSSCDFPGLVDRTRSPPTYYCGIFTHSVDAQGNLTAFTPHCILCFGRAENIE